MFELDMYKKEKSSLDPALDELLALYGKNYSDIVLDILFKDACIKFGVEYMDWVENPSKYFRCLMILSVYSMSEDKLTHNLDKILNKLGMDPGSKSHKQTIFESFLYHEGFKKINWASEKQTDVIYKDCGPVDRKLCVVHEPNKVVIAAKLYSTREKTDFMSNDKFEWDDKLQNIMSNKWIYDVAILADEKEVTYDDLFQFLSRLHKIRWRPVN